MRPITRAWLWLMEPRRATAARIGTYGAISLAGLSVLADSTRWLVEALQWAEPIWATGLIVGGILGVIATPRGLWWLERAAVILCGNALAVYAGASLTMGYRGAPGNYVLPACVAIALGLTLRIRWRTIRTAWLDPAGDPRPVRRCRPRYEEQ